METKMRTSTRLLAALGAMSLSALGGVLVMSEPALAVDTPSPLTAAQVRGSIAYLQSEYGVSESEALRRLDLQRMNAVLDEQLALNYPDTFAGAEIDQAAGGLLLIHATDTRAIAQAVREVRDVEHIRVVGAKYSLKELYEVAGQLDAELNTHGGKQRVAEAVADVQQNAVVVYQHAGEQQAARATAAERKRLESESPASVDTRIARAAVRHGDRVKIRQMIGGKEKMKVSSGPVVTGLVSTPSCIPEYCGKPMRGGQRLDVRRNSPSPVYPNGEALNATWGQCTNGFNIKDSRGWSFILTAGHCTVGPNKTGDTRTFSSYETGRTPVGYELGDWENANVDGASSYPWDFALQPYVTTSTTNYAETWLSGYSRNLVNSYCWSSEGTNACTEGTFGITGYYGYGSIDIGWVVCGSGSADASSTSGYHSNIGYYNGTRCGGVTAKDGGIRTNLCMRPGDSGGPLFSEADSKAYGILTDGTDGSGKCPTNPAGREYSRYTPISNAFSLAKTQSGYTFNVHTS
ncbi:hypothetical protein [Micromonospora sp. NPDC049203]|uniref:hypothetical protein n=1 Tax=Micromonospora sp. NPDC049203 TaxID=3364267 RepID=UPI00371BF3C3